MAAKKNPAKAASAHKATALAAKASRADASLDHLLSFVDVAAAPAAAKSAKAPLPPVLPGPSVLRIVGLDAKGRPLVDGPGKTGSKSIPALCTVRVTLADIGREALVFFEDGDQARPIVTGLIEKPQAPQASQAGIADKIKLEAGQELVLKCGPASITLTKDGRVVIRGADVLTRSTGSNRIKGGAVHIN
ncbi:MAG: DUF6484 domain-containing protein [Fibrobacteria bacterium]